MSASKELVDIGEVRDLYRLLEAIEEAFAGSDVHLCLESAGFASEIESFLHAHAISTDPPGIERETKWPRSHIYCLAFASGDIASFVQLARQYAEPEVCEHLRVVDKDETLLTAPDAGFGHVHIKRSYAEAIRSRVA